MTKCDPVPLPVELSVADIWWKIDGWWWVNMSAYNFLVSKPKFAFFRSSRILAVGAGREAHLTSKARRAFWIKPETKHRNSPKQFQVCFSLIIAYSFAYWKKCADEVGKLIKPTTKTGICFSCISECAAGVSLKVYYSLQNFIRIGQPSHPAG